MEGWIRARDLAEVPIWRALRGGHATCSARVCFGPGARLITRLARADGLVVGRRILLAPRAWKLAREESPWAIELLEHELVHVEQYRRLGFVRFLWRYLGEYFAGRLRGLDHLAAYRAISLEREARAVAAERLAAHAHEGRPSSPPLTRPPATG